MTIRRAPFMTRQPRRIGASGGAGFSPPCRTAAKTAILLLTLAPLLSAADATLALEPSHTEIEFTVGTLLHTVHGTFVLKRGVVHFDPATGAASGELAVDAASGHSGSDGRDKRMGKEILECLSFPEIVFVPDRLEGEFHATAPSEVRLHGQLRIHGASHEIVMQVRTEPDVDGLKATATFSVPYVSWGMKNPTTLFLKVNGSVEVKIHATGHLSQPVQ